MVVFEDGGARRSRTTASSRCAALEGQDDFGAMREVITRRFSRLGADPASEDWNESFAAAPNLAVIDGGKGQLSAALAAMQELDLPRVAVISLAKRIEEVFVPGRADPILLPRESPALQLLQRIRDEAHRFAITFHRQRRDAAFAGARCSTSSKASARRGAAHCCSTSARRSASLEATSGGAQRRAGRSCQDGPPDLRPAAPNRTRVTTLPRVRRLIPVLAAAAVLAGCGSSSPKPATTTAAPPLPPGRVLYEGSTWSVAVADGEATAYQLVHGQWWLDRTGKVHIDILGPEARVDGGGSAAQIAVELTGKPAARRLGHLARRQGAADEGRGPDPRQGHDLRRTGRSAGQGNAYGRRLRANRRQRHRRRLDLPGVNRV